MCRLRPLALWAGLPFLRDRLLSCRAPSPGRLASAQSSASGPALARSCRASGVHVPSSKHMPRGLCPGAPCKWHYLQCPLRPCLEAGVPPAVCGPPAHSPDRRACVLTRMPHRTPGRLLCPLPAPEDKQRFPLMKWSAHPPLMWLLSRVSVSRAGGKVGSWVV